ncbi:MAG: DUF1007 family protein [Fibrobacterota bacterium]
MKKTLLLLLFCILSRTLYAHAHIFIHCKVHGVVNERGFRGAYVNWSFDRIYSSFLIREFAEPEAGSFTEEQEKDLFENSFQRWKDESYFTEIRIDNRRIVLPEPREFSARITGEIVEFTFYIPLPVPAEDTEKNISIQFLDPVMYVDFTLEEDNISQSNNSSDSVVLDNTLRQRRNIKSVQYIFSRH